MSDKHDLLNGDTLTKVFKVSGQSGDPVIIHQNLAMTHSGYFRGLLRNDGNSGFEENETCHVKLKDTEHETLKALAAFLYTKRMGLNFRNNKDFLPAFKLYILADYLQIPRLKKKIIDSYFWAVRRRFIKPTFESTEFLFTHPYPALELRSLVVCHWRECQKFEVKGLVAPKGNKEFIGLLKTHIFKNSDGFRLKALLDITNIKPNAFYSEDVVAYWREYIGMKAKKKRQPNKKKLFRRLPRN